MLTTDEIAAMKTRCEAATRKPGTYVTDSGGRGRIYTRCQECHEAIPLYDHKSSCSGFERNKEAVAFAADALKLIAEVERLHAAAAATILEGRRVLDALQQQLAKEQVAADVDAAEGTA